MGQQPRDGRGVGACSHGGGGGGEAKGTLSKHTNVDPLGAYGEDTLSPQVLLGIHHSGHHGCWQGRWHGDGQEVQRLQYDAARRFLEPDGSHGGLLRAWAKPPSLLFQAISQGQGGNCT